MSNGTKVTLYAWVRPLDIDPLVDHTWVTTYAPPPTYATIQDVVKAGGSYWFCWGSYHPKAESKTHPGGAIGNAPGDLAISSCICAPNDPNAHGSIFTYAWDGVCHQLANQVLYSTAAPLTVKLARGYWTSSHLYGTYGRNTSDWTKLRNSCTGAQMAQAGEPPDDFADHVAEVLGADFDRGRLEKLMTLRQGFHARLGSLRASLEAEAPETVAENINRMIADHMAQAAEILGAEDYERVYGIAAGKAIKLVDPEMVRMSTEE